MQLKKGTRHQDVSHTGNIRKRLFTDEASRKLTRKEPKARHHVSGVSYSWKCSSCPAAFQYLDDRVSHETVCKPNHQKSVLKVKRLSPIPFQQNDSPRCISCKQIGCWGECRIISQNADGNTPDGFEFAASDDNTDCSNCLKDGCWGECRLKMKGPGKKSKK